MLLQVEIAPGCDTFQFLASEGEVKGDIGAGGGVVGQFVGGVDIFMQFTLWDSDGGIPFQPFFNPIIMPFLIFSGRDEKFQRNYGFAPTIGRNGLLYLVKDGKLIALKLPEI